MVETVLVAEIFLNNYFFSKLKFDDSLSLLLKKLKKKLKLSIKIYFLKIQWIGFLVSKNDRGLK
jgi:hypothetical protein